ncbi:MAG TPA: mismatch-specific DNA-glycosylase [Stellaceae bacterium]|nr:mismatch-specific DNA-glycosylase [Stellaceae bacterium]
MAATTPGGDGAARGATLPDLLCDGLDVVFVGINPSLYAVARGHYFARPANRFWPCFSRSRLSGSVRAAMGLDRLEPIHDRMLSAHGFGFTDLVKRPTARADALDRAELAGGVGDLAAKLARHRPRVACLHGMTVLRHVHAALSADDAPPSLGRQTLRIGGTLVFAVPNPSPANAHFTPADQTLWYDRLAEFLAALGAGNDAA